MLFLSSPVPIISKFVDIVVNGIAERTYDIKAYSQDPYGANKRTEYMKSLSSDMELREFDRFAAETYGINTRETEEETLPETNEELMLHMQLNFLHICPMSLNYIHRIHQIVPLLQNINQEP